MTNKLLCVCLTVVVLAATTHAQPTAPRTILMAPPQVGADVSTELASSVDGALQFALTQHGTRLAQTEQVNEGMRQTGVGSLAARGDAIKVARAIGAHALMRYTVQMSGERPQLQLAIYLTGTGKAVMLERELDPVQLQPTVDAMVVELLGPVAPPPAPIPNDRPASQPTPPAPSASDPMIHAARGLAFTFFVGGSAPLGGNHEFLSTGLRIGTHLGFQLRIGRRHALTPELTLGYTDWGFAPDTVVTIQSGTIPVTGGVSMFNLFAGLRYSLYLGPVQLYIAARGGLGYLDLELKNANNPADRGTDSATHVGFEGDLGAHYMFLRYVGAGVFLDVTKTFNAADAGTLLSDFGGMGFAGGLSLRGKIPL